MYGLTEPLYLGLELSSGAVSLGALLLGLAVVVWALLMGILRIIGSAGSGGEA